MSYEEIAELLEKYFDGETEIHEERLLKDYFNGPRIDDRLTVYRTMFQFFETQKEVQMPAMVALAGNPQSAKLITLRGGKLITLRGGRRFWSVAAAAAMVLAFAAGGWLYQRNMAIERTRIAHEKLYNDTFEGNPEQAMAEIKAALALVSRKMNKGEKKAAKGLQKISTLDSIFKQPN